MRSGDMSFWQGFKKAFAIDKEAESTFTGEEIKLLEKLAAATRRKGLTVPAILFFESFRPMNFVGSQVMFFFRPLLSLIADTTTYEKYAEILSRRGSVDKFLEILEKLEDKNKKDCTAGATGSAEKEKKK